MDLNKLQLAGRKKLGNQIIELDQLESRINIHQTKCEAGATLGIKASWLLMKNMF